MHSDHPYLPQKPMLPLADQVGYYMQNAPLASLFNARISPPGKKPLVPPFRNVDVQLSAACPRNFIIIDQTYNRSSIMFHPEIGSRLPQPNFAVDASIFEEKFDQNDANDEVQSAFSMKEDSADIDALLSMEYEENEQCDDDMVSTARTNAKYECNSPDSCSNYESESSVKSKSSLRKPYGSRRDDKKRQKMRKTVKALKGIVPGTNRMSTVAVLDEAVRYLKSLKVDVQKLGVGNLKG